MVVFVVLPPSSLTCLTRFRLVGRLLLWSWSFFVAAGLGLLGVAVCLTAIAATNDVDRLSMSLALTSLLAAWSISAMICHIARVVSDECSP